MASHIVATLVRKAHPTRLLAGLLLLHTVLLVGYFGSLRAAVIAAVVVIAAIGAYHALRAATGQVDTILLAELGEGCAQAGSGSRNESQNAAS
ncbi:hypothetical protein [Amycolatopsis cihanbeyliensis]|uniref:Uncharacterized protein n=1 Tax=Amycolatopsis cihanbeyliensis TaxID=1128664 RepID=A0A542CSE7_AMYCI|nr:hypothetical protein [Amycolatopsis cihanbeyliensis]TQI93749.1 hypothetical protein FB471_5891 [Amycolatopsis cihanbeyliensis]